MSEEEEDSSWEEHSEGPGRGSGSLTVPRTDWRAEKMEQTAGQGEEDGQRSG